LVRHGTAAVRNDDLEVGVPVEHPSRIIVVMARLSSEMKCSL